MENTQKTDVLIIGAGPTGLTMAAQLIRYGVDFILVDKKEGPTDQSKALVVHARSLELLDQMGLADKAIEHGELIEKAIWLDKGKTNAEFNFADFGKGLSPFPYVLVHEQSKTEHLLYDYLTKHGKDVWWKTTLNSLKQDENGVQAVLKTDTGDTQTIDARYVVGADGASSPVRHLLDLGFGGSTSAKLFYVADVEMDYEADASTLYVAFRGYSFMLMVPMAGKKYWRFIGNMPEYDGQSDRETPFSEIEEKVKDLIQQPLNITKVRWFSTYKVHTRHAERFSVGRCFLAGDAAHVHTPAGGQGMNTGIQDAYNLAWKMVLVLRGQATDSLLETYNEERLANAKHLLQTTDEFFNVATGDQWWLRVFRDNILPGVVNITSHIDRIKAMMYPEVSMIDINYRGKSLSRNPDKNEFDVKAGDRMPYFLVDGASGYDKLAAPRFHLLIFSDGQSSYDGLKNTVESEYGDLMDLNVVPLYLNIANTFGTEKPFLVLLRPDNHIGLLTTAIDVAAVHDYLSEVVGLKVPQLS